MRDTKKLWRAAGYLLRNGMLAGLSACLLAACSTTSDMPASEAQIVRASSAFILPPPGGPAIVTVVETRFPNAIRQDVSLATEARSVGENKISIIRFTGRGGDGSDAALKDIPFTQVNLTEEALAAWPNSGMAVSPYYVQNAYGPFGYAIAKPPNGDSCLYAWQRIEPALKPSGAVDRGAIIIRLQLCRRGVSEEMLLSTMYNLRLNIEVFPALRAPAAIGRIAAPIKPIGAAGFAEVIPTSQPAPRPAAAQPRPAPVATPAVTTIPVPPPGAPIVPGPTGTGGQTGAVVPRPPATSVIVPSPSASGN
ncbi:cellulose biosynthesis protein BcsN [Devosia sp.]|uniref:cellulose biosynthesis protein BcsN n=1 Tax=Devosia sp. TaxID=1871048 RepID=UPI001B0D8736|nr:cellulose biosynthesis protein BcsN [Devosia sp.]MBO9588938.1 cellulose biosynthesis protein BcsN [Devosia sp.]